MGCVCVCVCVLVERTTGRTTTQPGDGRDGQAGRQAGRQARTQAGRHLHAYTHTHRSPACHDTDQRTHEAHAHEEEDDREGLLDGRRGVEVCVVCACAFVGFVNMYICVYVLREGARDEEGNACTVRLTSITDGGERVYDLEDLRDVT